MHHARPAASSHTPIGPACRSTPGPARRHGPPDGRPPAGGPGVRRSAGRRAGHPAPLVRVPAQLEPGRHPGQLHQPLHPALHGPQPQVQLLGHARVGQPGQQQREDLQIRPSGPSGSSSADGRLPRRAAAAARPATPPRKGPISDSSSPLAWTTSAAGSAPRQVSGTIASEPSATTSLVGTRSTTRTCSSRLSAADSSVIPDGSESTSRSTTTR